MILSCSNHQAIKYSTVFLVTSLSFLGILVTSLLARTACRILNGIVLFGNFGLLALMAYNSRTFHLSQGSLKNTNKKS